jgi:hypothetical protein
MPTGEMAVFQRFRGMREELFLYAKLYRSLINSRGSHGKPFRRSGFPPAYIGVYSVT